MRYSYDCVLRWSDLDAFGHVNNARFLTLYEEARVALMFTGARRYGLRSFAEGVVIFRHEVDYLRPVDYHAVAAGADGSGPAGPRSDGWPATGPSVRIEMWVEEVRVSRFVIAYELFTDGALASRARSVCVPYDLVAGRPRRLTDAEREFLRPWSG